MTSRSRSIDRLQSQSEPAPLTLIEIRHGERACKGSRSVHDVGSAARVGFGRVLPEGRVVGVRTPKEKIVDVVAVEITGGIHGAATVGVHLATDNGKPGFGM